MPFDAADPDQAAALEAAREAVRKEAADALAKVAKARDEEKARADRLDGELATTKQAAEKALKDYTEAKAAGESTAAELLKLKTAADAAAKQADDAVIASLPETVRPLVAGKTGADLKAAADALLALANKPAPGRATGDGPGGETLTSEMTEWAKAQGYAEASPATIIRAWKKFGPGNEKSPQFRRTA